MGAGMPYGAGGMSDDSLDALGSGVIMVPLRPAGERGREDSHDTLGSLQHAGTPGASVTLTTSKLRDGRHGRDRSGSIGLGRGGGPIVPPEMGFGLPLDMSDAGPSGPAMSRSRSGSLASLPSYLPPGSAAMLAASYAPSPASMARAAAQAAKHAQQGAQRGPGSGGGAAGAANGTVWQGGANFGAAGHGTAGTHASSGAPLAAVRRFGSMGVGIHAAPGQGPARIGAYTIEQRRARIQRYHDKRKRRYEWW